MIYKINKLYLTLFIILSLIIIIPFTYSKYTSKLTKHIVISAADSGYTVEFNANGGTGTMPNQSMGYNVTESLFKSTFTRDDYVFLNWNTKADGTGTSYEDEEEVINLAPNGETITLYAIYAREVYIRKGDVTFDGQNGENPFINTNIFLFNERNINRDFEVSFEIKNRVSTGGQATMMSAMDETGSPWPGMVYRVTGKTQEQLVANATDSDFYNKNYTSTNIQKVTLRRVNGSLFFSINDGEETEILDMELIQQPFDFPVVFGASFNKNKQPQRWFLGTLSNLRVIVKDRNMDIGTIKYNANGGTGSSFSQNVSSNSTYNLKKNTYVREDYEFTGWNTKADGTGDQYDDEEEVTNLVEGGHKIVLYAQWRKYKYIVRFDANGGTGSMPDQEFDSGVSQNLTRSTFTKPGYSFAFWNTKADGSGISYEDEDSVKNIGSKDNQIVTLYAFYETFSYVDSGNIVFDGTAKFDGKEYIDTHIYLFSRKNVNKDFEISFNIISYNNRKNYDTIISSMDEAGTPYPGFVFRIDRGTARYELEANSSSSREVDNFYPLTVQSVIIKRVNGVLYLNLDGNEEELVNYSTISRSFYYPVTVGASLDKNFVDWRYFYGTISNLSITLDNNS